MKTTITSLLLLLSTALLAQDAQIHGIITDGDNSEPLPGTTIRSGSLGSVSGAEGHYLLKLPAGNHELVVYLVGYNSKTINVRLAPGENLEMNILLTNGENLLQQTTVTAGKFEKPLGEVTVSLDVLKPKLIESTNATSVDEVLTKVPGVTILDGQAAIRGGAGFSYGAGTRVLILVNDMPALQPDAGLPNWDDFPVENVAQVEVLKGAASALYGSSAMNGIINFRTGYAKENPETDFAIFGKLWGSPKDKNKQWWGHDTSSLQTPFETGFSFAHRQKFNKLDFVLGTYGLYRDSYNRDTYSRYGRITPNLRYQINDRLSISLNSNFNFGKSGSFFIWGNDSTLAYQPGLNSSSYTKGKLRFTIDPGLQYFDRGGNRHKILTRYFYIHNNNSGNQSNESRMSYAEYQYQRSMENLGMVLTAGAVAVTTSVAAELYSNADFSTQNYAGYVQLDQKLFDRLNLSAGMRYEQNIQKSPEFIQNIDGGTDTIPNGVTTEAKPVFRLGANYQIAAGTYLRASWGQGYRYPTIAEKFITTDFSVGNTVGPNAKLVSETGWTAELGIKQGFRLGSWQGFVDATGFISEYSNMMEFVLARLNLVLDPGPPPAIVTQAVFQSQNIGDTKVKGGELSILGQGKVGKGTLSLLTGYTYIDPKYKEFTEHIDQGSSVDYNVLKYRFKHLVKFDGEYQLGRFSLGTSYQYYSKMDAIDAIFEVDIVEPFGGVKNFRETHNHGFHVVDLRTSWQITEQLKASFLIGNALNAEYTFRPALLEAPRNYTFRVDCKLR